MPPLLRASVPSASKVAQDGYIRLFRSPPPRQASVSWVALTQITHLVYSSPWEAGVHRQPLPTLSTGRNWTRQERIHRKPTAKPTGLTPSMAYPPRQSLGDRVWILGPRVRFAPPAPARKQSLPPAATHTPEPRLPTCPTWAAAPPSAAAGALLPAAGRAPASVRRVRRTGPAGVERDLSDKRSADSGPSRQAALPTVLPQAGPTATLQGVHIVPEARGSSWGTGGGGAPVRAAGSGPTM